MTYAKGTLENLTRVVSPPMFQDAPPPLECSMAVRVLVSIMFEYNFNNICNIPLVNISSFRKSKFGL